MSLIINHLQLFYKIIVKMLGKFKLFTYIYYVINDKQLNKNKMANTKKQFVPLTNIKCIKNVGFGFQLGILYEGLDYDAEKFREKDGLILFTLSDKKGWIGDYMVETENFLIK